MHSTRRIARTAAGALTTLALTASTGAAATVPVSTGHSGWSWGYPAPQGQNLSAVTFQGADGYAAGAFGTVLKSTDGGATWQGLASGTIQNLDLVQQISPSALVVAGGCMVFESTDGGTHFSALPLNLGEGDCQEPVQAVSFTDPQHGYVELTDGTLMYTDDGGQTLQAKTNVPLGSGAATGMAFTSPTTGVAISGGGEIERTTDGGNSWSEVASERQGLNGITFVDAQHGFAVGNGGEMVGTSDGGQTWTPLPLKLSSGSATPSLEHITCSDASTCLIVTVAGKLVRTSDGGQTGTLVSPANTPVTAAAFTTGSNVTAVGGLGTALLSSDGGSTFTGGSSTPLDTFQAVTDPVAGLPGHVYLGGAGGLVAATADGGATWSEMHVPTPTDIGGVQFPTAKDGYILDGHGGVRSTTNGGLSWRTYPGTHSFDAALSAPSVGTVLLLGPKGITRSTDGGASFTPESGTAALPKFGHQGGTPTVTTPALPSAAPALATLKLGKAVTHGRTIVAWGASGVVESTDAGRSWTVVPLPISPSKIKGVSVVSARTIWLRDSSNIYETAEAGSFWREVNALGGIGTVRSMSFSSDMDGMVTIASAGPLESTWFGQVSTLATTDGGVTWVPEFANGAQNAAVLDTHSAAYLLPAAYASDAAFFMTATNQGLLGTPTTLTLSLPQKQIAATALKTAGGKISLSGSLSPVTSPGQHVVVSYRTPGGRWLEQEAPVASDGSYSLTIKNISGTTDFVAQSLGNGVDDGAGTPVQELVVKP